MKGKSRFFVKVFCMMIAVLAMFLLAAVDKADAGSVLIPISEFTIDGGTGAAPGSFYKYFSGGYLAGSIDYPCFLAPVRIPGSATKINKVIVYFTDTNATSDPWFQLTALNMATTEYEDYTYGAVEGTDTIQAIEVPLLKQKLVRGRVYQLGTCLDADQQLYGVKVVYTVP